jgi:hypothetical protein
MKKTLIGFGFVVAALGVWGAGGCGKSEATCDAVFEHVRDLAPADMRDLVDAGKDGAIKKCEAMSAEQRKCILAADDLAELASCKK